MGNFFVFLGHAFIALFAFTHVIHQVPQTQLVTPTLQPTPSIVSTVTPLITSEPQKLFFQTPTPAYRYQQTNVTTSFPTTYPTPVPVRAIPSAFPTPSTVIHPEASVRGYYDNPTGDPTPLSGQALTIKGLDNGNNYLITTEPFFYSPSLPEGRYQIIAATLPGYTTSYSMCMDCTFHANFDNGNIINVLLPNSPHYLDVIFRYTHQ